jgi:hypothetical protein
MNLNYNFINPIIFLFVSLYFYSSTRKYTMLKEQEQINQYTTFLNDNRTFIKVHDINEEYNYIVNNINKKEDEMKFINNLKSHCKLYIQGGAVRDALLNYTIRDIDLKTNCPINIILKNLPIDCKYKIINNVIRIYEPVLIDISQINNIFCNDFTINGFYFDYKNNILFNIYDSMINFFNKKLIFGCDAFDPKYNLPFRFIKFKLRNYTYTEDIENNMFDKFYYLYTNEKDIYNKKVNYYMNEWYNNTVDQQLFLDELKIFENKANNISVLIN